MVAPIFTERSGRPYSYEIFGGTRLSGGMRASMGPGGRRILPTVGRKTLRLPDAFKCGFAGEPGGGGWGAVEGAGMVDVFNVTNHVNYSGVTTRAFLAGDER